MQMKSFPVHITTVLSIIISNRTVHLRRILITTFRFNLFSAYNIYRYSAKLSNVKLSPLYYYLHWKYIEIEEIRKVKSSLFLLHGCYICRNFSQNHYSIQMFFKVVKCAVETSELFYDSKPF